MNCWSFPSTFLAEVASISLLNSLLEGGRDNLLVQGSRLQGPLIDLHDSLGNLIPGALIFGEVAEESQAAMQKELVGYKRTSAGLLRASG